MNDIVIPGTEHNTPAMMLCAKLANIGTFVETMQMQRALDAFAVPVTIETLSQGLATQLRKKFEDRPLLNCWSTLLDYLNAKLVALDVEEVRVLYLNPRNHLIADEVHHRGTVDECPVHIREIVRRALDVGATALILAHNHPSGDPTPSTQDIRITNDLQDACRPLKITIHDHVIVGGSASPVSMRAQGLLK